MRPILTTMTALVVVMSALPAAEAGKIPNMNVKPKVQVIKIRPPRIHVPRPHSTRARTLRQDGKPMQKDGPPANRARAPVKTIPARKEVQVFTQLPRPRPDRPYDEFQEAGNDSNVGPDTGLPEDDSLFDETLVALLPGLWGHEEHNALEDAANGALDKAFDNEPQPVGPFDRDDGRPDLANFEPGGQVQPGGPNDPAAGGQLPEFFDDPFARPGNDEGQGWSSPSQVLNDPRGQASDGSMPNTRHTSNETRDNRNNTYTRTWNNETTSRYVVHDGDTEIRLVRHSGRSRQYSDGTTEVQVTGISDTGSVVVVRIKTDPDGTRSAVITTHDPNTGTIDRHSVVTDADGNVVHEERQISEPSDPVSQPGINPSSQEQAAAQAWICNNTPWMCRSGGGGSTPNEMLTQPAQPGDGTGSIMDTDDGPALGREAVTNTGDASWNTTDSEGNGGGGGGSSSDWWREGDPDDGGPGGPID
ncbi:MAG TPA: hypothetical protein VK862_21170 [Afifellaceae bacterium]|nr:hypothetical protein [Afifellaceae bacterium]